MGRRPLSIVKNVLNRNCSNVHNVNPFDQDYFDYDQPNFDQSLDLMGNSATPNSTCIDWPPFDNDATANQLLAMLDSAFLFSYAICMFFSGYLADRCNLRYFLSSGMIMSGFLLYAFGLSYRLNIHSMAYFVIIQILSGAIQTTGWPSVITSVGNWFDRSSRGAIFGLWNANTNLGNILGAVIAGYFVEEDWGLSFIVPGFIMSFFGVIAFLFLVPRPEDVGLHPLKAQATPTDEHDVEGGARTITEDELLGGDGGEAHHRRKAAINHGSRDEFDPAVSESPNEEPILDNDDLNSSGSRLNREDSPLIAGGMDSTISSSDLSSDHNKAVSFWTCLAIPGVIEYSLCLGFAKLVSYTFLYWLPRYISQSTLNNSEDSAYLSVPFDIGGAFGAIVAGVLSDRYRKSGLTCTIMLLMAIPSMVIYEKFASTSNFWNIVLQLIAGSLVNGPYALITTAVSTDLGSRVKSGKAMATVASIIDGTGSIGAAIGPLVAGCISDYGWQAVFVMLMASDLIASFCLIRITLKELGFRS